MTRTITEINLGDFKLRFDPNEVRISIDGDKIDVGARIPLTMLESQKQEEQSDRLSEKSHPE